jgi:hypothetical protein
MEITLTKAQYQSLLKMVFLGNWIINAPRTETIKEFDELEEHIFSFARTFGLENEIDFDENTGRLYPSEQFENSLSPYIDEYNENNMWQELISILSHRDLVEEIGEDNLKDLDRDTFNETLDTLYEKYEQEFSENGIQNLRLE